MALNDNNFYTITGWMRNKLHLDGNELIVYAVIYSYSQDGISELVGGIKHLMDCTGCGRRTIIRILSDLEERGLIMVSARNKISGKPNAYSAVPLDFIFSEGGCAKMAQGVCQNGTGGVPKWHTHIGNNISNISCKKERKKEEINKSNNAGARVKNLCDMTDEEILAYKDKLGVQDLANFDFNEWQALNDELQRRGEKLKPSFVGKLIVDEHGRLSRLKSYEEIMTSYGLCDRVKTALYSFIQHCKINGNILTNAKLEDLIMRLEEYDDDADKVAALNEAVNMGYFDIKLKKTWLNDIRERDSDGTEKN